MRPELTYQDVRDLDHEELIERAEKILAEFDPEQVETPSQRLARINRTLDEMPQVYRWFLQLKSFCDHWADFSFVNFRQKDLSYKKWRQRRDFFESMASASKLRWEGASRMITVQMEFDVTGMARHRKGP